MVQCTFQIVNPLIIPMSDQHVISPNSNTAESFMKFMRITEMVANLTKLLIAKLILFFSAKGLSREDYREYSY